MNRLSHLTLIVTMFIPVLPAQDAERSAMRSALAPGGVLRAVFLAANPVQGKVDAQTGAVTGPAFEVTQYMAQRMGVAFSVRGLDGVPAVMDAVSKGTADIGFLAFDPTRAADLSFSQPYSIGHNTYMVLEQSPIRTIADADRAGIRIGVGSGDAVDLHLTRTLKLAEIVRPANRTIEEAVRLVTSGEISAFAANRQRLTEAVARAPHLRLVPGSVLPVQQSIVTAKENKAGTATLDRLIDEMRSSGLLRDVIERAKLAGVEVAPQQIR